MSATKLGAIILVILALGVYSKISNPPDILQQREAQRIARVEAQKREEIARKAEFELYSQSPDAKKAVAQLILTKQFPGWCNWSTAVMVVRSDGDVVTRCNGATFLSSEKRGFAMRFIDGSIR